MTGINNGIWFVYDGDCPLCRNAAQALAIKKECGELHLLNARHQPEHPLLQEINSRGLDLDEGMVIYHDDTFHHGKDALKFMARHGRPNGFFNCANRYLFRSDRLAAFFYPWMRGARNVLLKCLGKSKIENLKHSKTPIFAQVFGDQWERLPMVFKQHYANRPYSDDRVTVEGILDVNCRSYMNLLRPFYRILGTVPVLTEKQVSVTVHFDSDRDSKAFHFNRIFYFSGEKPYHFRSRMLPIDNNEIFEIMRFGICWRARFDCDDNKVSLTHKGYAIKLGNFFLPLPMTWLIGRGGAEEVAIDNSHFDMKVEMRSPLFGLVYSYAGRFEVTKPL